MILVSSDLSHYLDESAAHIRDLRTTLAVLALDAAAIGDHDACGAHALRGLLAYARQAGWTGTLLKLRTSADATGDRSRASATARSPFATRDCQRLEAPGRTR